MKPVDTAQALQRLAGYSEWVGRILTEWNTPGMAISIVMDGQVIFAEGFGLRDVKAGLPVTPETLFAIGSTTKAFASAGVGILVDDGKLEWDRPVRTWLPEFQLYDPIATEHMTPRDLLCHRSGLPRHDLVWYNSPRSREEIVRSLRYLEPNREFRQEGQYQNGMVMTAGYLAGKVSGMSWEEFTRRRILEPLGMSDTSFSVETSKTAGNFSRPYMDVEMNGQVREVPFCNLDEVGAAGSINSNILDMSRWVAMHLNKGRVGDRQVISEASLARCHEPILPCGEGFPMDEGPELGRSCYAMGWWSRRYRGEDWEYHPGGIDGFTALVSLLPKRGIGIVVLSNAGNNVAVLAVTLEAIDRLLEYEQTDWSARLLRVIDAVKGQMEKARLDAVSKVVPNTLPSHPLVDYVGDYEHPGYGVFRVELDDGKLTAIYNRMRMPLNHAHYDQFDFEVVAWNQLIRATFLTDDEGRISRVSAPFEPAVKPIEFVRRVQ